jgi:hypothetical protein
MFTSKRMPFNSPLGHQPSPHHLHSPTPVLAQSLIYNQLPNPSSSTSTPQKPSLKRARSDDEDDAMDGSPSPLDKRVLTSAKGRKIAPIKRLRVETVGGESPGRNGPKGAEEKKEEDTPEDEVDAGVLLGMSTSRFQLVTSSLINSRGSHASFLAGLPASSHLPLLQALLTQMPQIKPILLSLIPRPTAETTRDAILDAVKKLREAVPYSATVSTSSPSTPQIPGTPTSSSGNTPGLGFTFGAATVSTSSFAFGAASVRPSPTPQQRDSYVLNRLRPAVQTFTTTVASYIPYFSLVPPPVTLASLQQRNRQSQPSQVNTKPPSHSETFIVLSTLTSSLLTLPPAAAQALHQQSDLHSRVVTEWKAWLNSLDNHVNCEGGIFGRDMAQSWLTALEAFSVGKPASTGHALGSGLAFGTNWSGGGRGGWGSPTMSSTGEWGTPLASPGGLGFGFGSTSLLSSQASSSMHHKDLVAQMKELKDDWILRVGWLAGRHAPPQGFDPMEEQ